VSTPGQAPPAGGAAPERARASRKRLVAARVLVILAIILTLPAALAGYVRWQVLDTDTFHDTAKQLIADDTVRNQVAASLVDGLYDNTDVTAALEQRLPPDQQRLAGPLTAVSRLAADRLAPRLLERPRVQQLWVNALTESQRRLVRLLDDKSTAVQEDGGDVVLNLRPLVIQLGEEVAIIGNVAGQLPPDAGTITIMKADNLQAAQDITKLLRAVGTWFWVIPLLLFAAGIALARGRRRIELRAVAVGLIVVGLAILLLRSVSGGYVVDALVSTETVKPAADDTWSILTQLLTDTAWTLIGIGLVALLGVWIAGDRPSGRATRRGLAPVLGNRVWIYGTATVLYLLLLWWRPTAQTSRVPQMIALAIVILVAIEALYRLTVRDFPGEAAIPPGAAMRARWDARRDRRAGAGPASSTEDLERLVRLHDSGALTDDEFAGEKARLLART
jgi:hypothetical protein